MSPPLEQEVIDELVEVFIDSASRHLGESVDDVLATADVGLAISAVAGAFASYAGYQPYPDHLSKAAVILVHLVRNHPLLNGVKRSALTTTDYYLTAHGYRLTIDPDEGFDFLVAVAEGRVNVDDARDWLKARTSRSWIEVLKRRVRHRRRITIRFKSS